MEEENKKNTVIVGLEKIPLKSEREEKKKKRKHIILVAILCVLFLVVGFAGGCVYSFFVHPVNKADATNTLGEIEALLQRYWIYSKDYDDLQTALEDKAFYGMTSFDEDPYTTYMSAEELEEFASTINMDYVGIGVMYSMQNDNAVIERVFANSPAQDAGLLPGDIINKVDGKSINGLTSDEIKQLVIGEKDSIVVITVIRDNEELDFSIIRDSVDNSVYCYSEDDYIVMELSSFGSNTAEECLNYLNQYEDYKKIIIDLRNNSGGYQISVKEIAGLFIGNGKVYLKQESADGKVVDDLTTCPKTFAFDKIVVLVNGNTASAAEVFALCLKEQLNNVTLVGENTYGKGVIQSTHYLSNGGVLKLSSFYWYSPNGVSIHKIGIKPDVEIKLDDIAYEYYEPMDENVVYKYGDIDEIVRLAELSFVCMDIDVDNTNGYFDESFARALNEYKVNNNLADDSLLDYQTYQMIMSDVILTLSGNEKDYQYMKAIELIKE